MMLSAEDLDANHMLLILFGTMQVLSSPDFRRPKLMKERTAAKGNNSPCLPFWSVSERGGFFCFLFCSIEMNVILQKTVLVLEHRTFVS